MEGLQLPQKCGVILLSDTVLFPHGALPLHIFEPRYRAMLADAIQGNCFFCVGNLLEAREGDTDQRPASIGTLGLIRASREAENGTSNVLLHGVMRVVFESWSENEVPYPYTTIRPILDTTLAQAEETQYLQRLQNALNGALSGFPKEVTDQLNEIIEHAGDSATASDAIAQQLIHDPQDRQRLLETTEVRKRLDFLIRFLERADPNSSQYL